MMKLTCVIKKAAAAAAVFVMMSSAAVRINAADKCILGESYTDGVYTVYLKLPENDMELKTLSVEGKKVKPEKFGKRDSSEPVRTTLIADRSSLTDEGVRDFTGVLREMLAASGENEYFRLVTIGNDGVRTVTDFTQNQMMVLNQAESISYEEEEINLASLLGEFYTENSGSSEFYERTVLFTGRSSVENSDSSSVAFPENSSSAFFIITGNEAFSEIKLKDLRCSGYCALAADSDYGTAAGIASDMSDVYVLKAKFTDEIIGSGGLKRVSVVLENETRTVSFEETVNTGDHRYESTEKTLSQMKMILALVSLAAFVLAAVLVTVIRKRKIPSEQPLSVLPRQTVSLSKKMDVRGTVFNSASTRILFRQTPEMKIVLTDTENPERKIEILSSKETVIGRNQSLADAVIYNERSVSQRHCRIFCRNSRVYAEDLGSLNHTFADGEEISGETEIFSGTILKIGRVSFEVRIE